jgi:hypothetical protein
MKRLAVALLLLSVLSAVPNAANPPGVDGTNDILAVVNGQAITYQQIVGGVDMQTEINTWRSMRRIPPETTDAEIERVMVYQRLQSFILQRLLDAEVEAANLDINNAQMRSFMRRERRALNIDEDDTRAWAEYLKTRYGLTPTEYRERRRQEILRSEMMRFMAGVYGPLPQHWPVEVYFSLSVTPREIRKAFDEQRERWRIALNIDYREFRLLYPQDINFDARIKLLQAVTEGEHSVHERVMRGESMEAASAGLRQLIDDLGTPGVRLEITERRVAADDRELDPTAYMMVSELPRSGGVSDVGSASDTDEDGTQFDGFMFVQLFSREDGTEKAFEDMKVQEGIRDEIFSRRFQENQHKVERDLLRRAAIVPEHLFPR